MSLTVSRSLEPPDESFVFFFFQGAEGPAVAKWHVSLGPLYMSDSVLTPALRSSAYAGSEIDQ
jgi:hypothetical protein